jgi:aryl-alcohol dehydrogenase-like predicted oxidoreductase
LIHWPDDRVDIRRPFEKLLEFKNKGWVKKIGLSNTNPEDYKKASEVAPIEVLQFEASFLVREPARQVQAFLACTSDPIPITTGWGTLAKGILTGRVFPGRKFDAHDARSHAPWWKWKEVEAKISRAQSFLSLAAELEISPACLSLFYSKIILRVHLPLIGFKSVADLSAAREFSSLLHTSERVETLRSRLNSL